MRSRLILTVAAATAATFGGGLASAGTAAATTAPLATPSPPKAPAAVPGSPIRGITGIADGLDIADGWCIAPTVPVAENLVSTAHGACGRNPRATDGGIHLLERLCLAPISLEGAPGHLPCDRVPTGPASEDDFSILRGASVAGLPLD